ncbi:chromate transporter [Propionivibrio sp.]|uniref:chromate transporter n=1 Tax=Propionivibrio sp. TaxID=2212460 RepID=UPI003BF296E3
MNNPLSTAPATISLDQIFRQFLYVGAISFGGGIVAYLRDLLVSKRQWVSSDEFMVMLSISQTMPGLNAVNLSILMGDRLRGGKGALVAALGILLPGALIVLTIGTLYGIHSDHPKANHVLGGVTAAAIALLATVTWKLGRRALTEKVSLGLVILTFVCMSILKLPLYLVLATVLPLALFLYRPSRNGDD